MTQCLSEAGTGYNDLEEFEPQWDCRDRHRQPDRWVTRGGKRPFQCRVDLICIIPKCRQVFVGWLGLTQFVNGGEDP